MDEEIEKRKRKADEKVKWEGKSTHHHHPPFSVRRTHKALSYDLDRCSRAVSHRRSTCSCAMPPFLLGLYNPHRTVR
jgi:hypothetical protein